MINTLTFKKKLAPLAGHFYRGKGSILMYHRIQPSSNRPRVHTTALEVTPENLRNQIQFFLDRKYHIVKMEAAPDFLNGRRKGRFVVFTFDDGYADNYTYAYPVFQEFGLPFTIYVTTDMVEKRLVLWQFLLEALLLKQDAFECAINGEGLRFSLRGQGERESAYSIIRRKLIDLSPEIRMENLEKLFGNGETLLKPVRELGLSWEQLREMTASGLLEVGGHTVTHPSLKQLNEGGIKEEVEGGRAILEERLRVPVNHFAYPYGSAEEIGSREVDVVSKTGFHSATTTRQANVQKAHRNHMFALPRIYVGPHTTLEHLADWIDGKIPFIRNSKKRVVTV